MAKFLRTLGRRERKGVSRVMNDIHHGLRKAILEGYEKSFVKDVELLREA